MNKFENRVYAVTGAGSGIGKALAYELANRGAKLALADIKLDDLDKVANDLRQQGAEIYSQQLDVADQNAVFDFANSVEKHFGAAHVIINNAGVALGAGPLWKTEIDDFKWLMDINFYGVLYGSKAFLPILQQQDFGHIVNISSLFGIIGVPEQNAYNASKFAVRGLTESLRHDLKLDNSTVSCTSVHPGGIKTNIARNARAVDASLSDEEVLKKKRQAASDFDKLARTTAESAAEQILRGIERDKQRVVIGADAKLMDFVQRLMPSSYGKLLFTLFNPKSSEL